jgi:hypothetical protein
MVVGSTSLIYLHDIAEAQSHILEPHGTTQLIWARVSGKDG